MFRLYLLQWSVLLHPLTNYNLKMILHLMLLNSLNRMISFIKKADEERPPGIDTGFIVAATAERAAYMNAKPAQRGDQARATTQRAERDTMVDTILTRRKKIQYAADRVWPHTDPAHAGVRGEFNLPLDRGYAY